MSVLSQKTEWQFKAPVTIGPKTISITGSWEHVPAFTNNELRMSPLHTAHLRLSTWKQQLRGGIVEICTDWAVYDNKIFSVYLRIFSANAIIMEDIDLVSDKVHQIITTHPLLYSVQKLFQQTQPGESFNSGCSGRAGNEGDNQSD